MKIKFTGVTRPIDRLGRIVIPKEIRDALNWNTSDRFEIGYYDDKVVLCKARSMRCQCCGGSDDLIQADEKTICVDCLQELLDAYNG